jgi:hypothetical protein
MPWGRTPYSALRGVVRPPVRTKTQGSIEMLLYNIMLSLIALPPPSFFAPPTYGLCMAEIESTFLNGYQ